MTTKNTPEQALDTIFDGQNISQESSGANYENPNKWDSNNESPAFNSFDLELLGPRPASPTTSWVGRPGLSMAEMEANFEAGKTTRRAQSKWDENSARIKSATPDINEAKNNTTAVDAWGDEVGSRQGSAGFGARSGNAGDHQASQPMPMTHFQVEYVRLHDVGSNSGQAAAGDDW